MAADTLLEHMVLYQGDYRVARYDAFNEFEYGRHYHDFYEVQFYLGDEGELCVGERTYQIKKGNVVLINIFEPHQFTRYEDCVECRYTISLTPDILLELCTEDSNLLTIFDRDSGNPPVLTVNDDVFNHCIGLLEKAIHVDLRFGRDIMERALVFEVLAYVYDQYYSGTTRIRSTHSDVTLIIKLVQYIEEHLHEDISLETLAREMNFNKFHISRTFKRITGYTVSRYIVAKKVEKVAPLLLQSDNIYDVIREYGFTNYSYFYKSFKRYYDMSPSEYKALLTKIESRKVDG